MADNYVIVAGIDFGTTYSGYAFSFKTAKEDIKVNKNWGEAQGFQSSKAPTTVLTSQTGEFLAFGYDAEAEFAEIDDDDEKRAGLPKQLYRHFKMILHKKGKLTMKTLVCSTTGQFTPAIDIFAHALRYLKENLLEELEKQLASKPSSSMIRWVITVPAIWSEEAKQFMRKATLEAKCITEKDSNQLIIALEPEAASFFCRQLELAHYDDVKSVKLRSGDRYLLLDLGGGTNDMVVHEVVLDYKVKELYAVSGGEHGGTNVDAKFIALLKDILGDHFIESFREEFPKEWFSFITKFERTKKACKKGGKSTSIELPWSMAEKYSVMHPEKSLGKVLGTMKSKGVSFGSGSLVLSNEVVQSLFAETIHGIVAGVDDAIKQPRCQHLNYIFMVGGFSESELVRDAIKKNFERNGCKVLVPREAQLAIIRGAVLFGHYQSQVVSRIARKTYGCAGNFPFKEGVHDESKKFVNDDGDVRCDDIFIPLVEMGEEIEIGSTKETVYGLRSKQTYIHITLHSMARKPQQPVEYIDHPDVSKLGQVIVQTPDLTGGADRRVVLRLTFGSTEILAEAIDQTSGNRVTTTIDFLAE